MQIIECSSSFTRPDNTTAYTSGDLMANSATADEVVPLTFNIPYGRGLKVMRVEVSKSAASVTNASYRVHLYKDSPTAANGDNGAWSTTSSNYLGYIDVVGTAPAFTDSAAAYGVYVNNSVFAPMLLLADKDRKVYGLLEARAGYTPASEEVFTVSLIGEAYL